MEKIAIFKEMEGTHEEAKIMLLHSCHKWNIWAMELLYKAVFYQFDFYFCFKKLKKDPTNKSEVTWPV